MSSIIAAADARLFCNAVMDRSFARARPRARLGQVKQARGPADNSDPLAWPPTGYSRLRYRMSAIAITAAIATNAKMIPVATCSPIVVRPKSAPATIATFD
jgi:hypothetical protein